MHELTTKDIISFLKSEGIELVGVAPIKPLLTDSRYEKNVERICPNAKCVVVFANTFPQSVLDACSENARPARFTLETLYAEGAEISVKLSRFLEKNGYRGVIIPAYLPTEMNYETLGLKGDLNLKLVAAEAGLGSRGVNDLQRILILHKVNEEFVLSALIKKDTPIGMATYMIEEATSELMKVL